MIKDEVSFWRKFEVQIRGGVDNLPGIAGISLIDITTGHTLAVNGDETFPTASSIKIQILAALLAQAETGEIDLAAPITVDPAHLVFGSGVLAYLEDAPTLTVRDVAILMIIASDNTATNLCMDLVGMDRVNDLIRGFGLTHTHLRRKMMDNLAAVRDLENVSTPNEMAQTLARLHAGQPSAWVGAETLRILAKPKSGYLNQALPDDLPVAHKPGSVAAAACDIGLVHLPRRPYIIAAMTKYAPIPEPDLSHALVNLFRLIHTNMDTLDRANQAGRTVW
ncbi:MAG: serine hydrolase [Caldilineaceae bacterium]|nr:serine hydrolase [Caldilineaceae bacterium]MBP9073292.1 serine hydrolase [Caldilineaceae bacterium]